jgi:hypothetical protein
LNTYNAGPQTTRHEDLFYFGFSQGQIINFQTWPDIYIHILAKREGPGTGKGNFSNTRVSNDLKETEKIGLAWKIPGRMRNK